MCRYVLQCGRPFAGSPGLPSYGDGAGYFSGSGTRDARRVTRLQRDLCSSSEAKTAPRTSQLVTLSGCSRCSLVRDAQPDPLTAKRIPAELWHGRMMQVQTAPADLLLLHSLHISPMHA